MMSSIYITRSCDLGSLMGPSHKKPKYSPPRIFPGIHVVTQEGEAAQIQRIDSDVADMNTIKKFYPNEWKFKCPLTCPLQNNQ